MNPIQSMQIAIVGGGPGGLTLARLLQQDGANVKVYERDVNRNVRVQGATLDLHEESGLAALQKAGLMDAFKSNYRPGADRLRLVDKDATILLDDHETKAAEEGSRPEIDRGPLRNILLDALQPETVVWDSHFKSITPYGRGWQLHFHNGSTAYADLVIAADGANSKLRSIITPIQPFYAGVTVVEGTVYHSETASPKMHQLLKGGKIFAMGNEKTIIVSSKGDGSLVFYTGVKTDEFWYCNSGIDFNDKNHLLNWFQQEFEGWSNIWLELIEAANLPFTPRPQYCMPLNQTWETLPNLTMLGDAAHLMPPYAGEGVNMAMLDALELSCCLLSNEFANTQSAIAAYEKSMLARFAEIGKKTLEQTASLHSPNAIADMMSMLSE